MGNECNGQSEKNVPHPIKIGKMVNCRNVWFREFWSQYHKCTFANSNSSTIKERQCTGDEELTEYDQEGLVPFVGNIKKQIKLTNQFYNLSNIITFFCLLLYLFHRAFFFSFLLLT